MEICLVASPLLGPSSWSPVADHLTAAGHTVRVVATTAAASGDPELVAADLARQIPTDRHFVLAVHSNAGAYVPAIAAGRSVLAAIFVDAVIPPSSGSTPLTRPDFLANLRRLADEDGLLPVWTEWWDQEGVAELLPDLTTRALIEKEQVRIPVQYFSKTVPANPGWEIFGCGYIEFGHTYDAERSKAETRGWPVRVLKGEHLEMVNNPEPVAAAILDMVIELRAHTDQPLGATAKTQ